MKATPDGERLEKRAVRRKGTSLLATCDDLFGKIVRHRGRCENRECGATTDLQCAHGFSRRYRKVRHDLRNGFCLCKGCHMRWTHDPIGWEDWLRSQWGDDQYRQIRFLAISGPRADLSETAARLRRVWEGLR